MPSDIKTIAIEGVEHDDSIIVVEEPERSYMIVKGHLDNIAIELSAEGWKNLSAIALVQSQKAAAYEAPVVDPDESETKIGRLIRKTTREGNMTIRDLANRMRCDAGTMMMIARGDRVIPLKMVTDLALRLQLDPVEVRALWDEDAREKPRIPIATFTFAARRR